MVNDGMTVSDHLVIHASVLNEKNISQKVSFSSVFISRCNRGLW